MRPNHFFAHDLATGMRFSIAIWFESAACANTSAQSEDDTHSVFILLSHLQIDNIGDDLFAIMTERTVPTKLLR